MEKENYNSIDYLDDSNPFKQIIKLLKKIEENTRL